MKNILPKFTLSKIKISTINKLLLNKALINDISFSNQCKSNNNNYIYNTNKFNLCTLNNLQKNINLEYNEHKKEIIDQNKEINGKTFSIQNQNSIVINTEKRNKSKI